MQEPEKWQNKDSCCFMSRDVEENDDSSAKNVTDRIHGNCTGELNMKSVNNNWIGGRTEPTRLSNNLSRRK